MKTVAVENAVYSKLLKLKSTLKHMRGESVSFSELLEAIIRRPLVSHFIDSTLMMAFRYLIKQVSQADNVHSIILFESMARRTYDAYSDVELFTLTDKADSETFHYIERSIRTTEQEYCNRLFLNKLPVHFTTLFAALKKLNFLDQYSPILLIAV